MTTIEALDLAVRMLNGIPNTDTHGEGKSYDRIPELEQALKDAETRKLTVHVAVIKHKHGHDVYTDTSEEGLDKQLAEYCREWWSDMGMEAEDLSDEDTINKYFGDEDVIDSGESMETTESVVNIPKTEYGPPEDLEFYEQDSANYRASHITED